MKNKRLYSRAYANALTSALVKQSGGVIPKEEAQKVSIGIAKTLSKNGQTAPLNSVPHMAKNIIHQKTRYEDGELVYVPGEGVTDTTTGAFIKEEE